MARGSVVVVLSDGWERGDPSLLAEQVRRLQRIAHRVVWVNPHRGKPVAEQVPASSLLAVDEDIPVCVTVTGAIEAQRGDALEANQFLAGMCRPHGGQVEGDPLAGMHAQH